MISSLLLEIPGAILLETSSYITGAYTSSIFLYKELIQLYSAHTIYLLTDCSEKELEIFRNTYFPQTRFVRLTYDTLRTTITVENQPSLSFSSDLSVDRLMRFRNQQRLSFPVVGLLHSLGMPEHFENLHEVLRSSTALDCLICPSQCAKQTVLNYAKTMNLEVPLTLTVIPFGIQIEKFKPTTQKSMLRHALEIPQEAQVILHLSRFNPFTKMDILPLLEMMPEILSVCPKAYLLMVGQPHSRDYVVQLKRFVIDSGLSKSVSIITEPDLAKIEIYYQVSDIFTSFSDGVGETFGLTILEAMACKLPVIISDWNGYKELIQEGVQGFKIPTYRISLDFIDKLSDYAGVVVLGDTLSQSVSVDYEKSKKRIIDLIQDVELRHKLAQCGQNHARQFFNLEKMITNYQVCLEVTFKKGLALPSVEFPPPRILEYAHLFDHFATIELNFDTIFSLSDRGKRALKKEEIFRGFEAHLIRYSLLPLVINSCLKSPCSASSLAAFFSKDEEEVLLNLMYAFKHGLLKIISQ